MGQQANKTTSIIRELFFTGDSVEALACQELLSDFRSLSEQYANKSKDEFDQGKSYGYNKISAGVVKSISKIERKANIHANPPDK